MILHYVKTSICILRFCLIVLMCLYFNACMNVMQDAFKSSSSYTIKYAYVQNDKIFLEEVKEIAKLLPKKETFSVAINELQELSDSYKLARIPELSITFTCAFNKHYEQTLQSLLTTRKYPCDNELAGYTLHSSTKNPYKKYYGEKFANIQNKEQFLFQYTKNYENIQSKADLENAIQAILANIKSNSNIMYDLRELKHYAFIKGIVGSYDDFYMLISQYEIKCQGMLFSITLDKAIMQRDLQCKKITHIQQNRF